MPGDGIVHTQVGEISFEVASSEEDEAAAGCHRNMIAEEVMRMA